MSLQLILSPRQKAYKEYLSEKGQTVLKNIEDTLRASKTVQEFIDELPEDYYDKLVGVKSSEEAFEETLKQVSFKDDNTDDLDYGDWLKDSFVSSEKQKKKEKTVAETTTSTEVRVKKKTEKKKAVIKHGEPSERDEKAIKWLVQTVKTSTDPVLVSELQAGMVEEFSMGGSVAYKLITAYGNGSKNISGLTKIKSVTVGRKRAYSIES